MSLPPSSSPEKILPTFLYQYVASFVRRHPREYGLAAFLLLIIALLVVWLPRQTGALVDAMVGPRTLPTPVLAWGVAQLFIAALIIYFLRVAWRVLLYSASYRAGMELRTTLYQQIILQSPAFFQTQRTGNLMALTTNDVDAVEMATGEGLLAGFDGTLTFVLVIAAMLFGVDWRLGLVALLPFPAMAWAFYRVSEHVHQHTRQALQEFGHLNDHVQESLTSFRTIRSLGLQAAFQRRFNHLAGDVAKAETQSQYWEGAYEPAVALFLAASVALSMALGGYLIMDRSLTAGQLTSFGMYLTQLIWPMFAIGWLLSIWQRGRAAWQRMAQVMQHANVTQQAGLSPSPRETSLCMAQAPALHLQDVCFAYPNATHPALKDLSLRLEAGKITALVGPTGGGKSTLLTLLLRLWEPLCGEIFLNDQNLFTLSTAQLRNNISWVGQEPLLFSATIAENIALGCPSASRSAIEQAARQAHVWEEIQALPRGMDTMTGERGITLSGGQRQRIALARALVRCSPLLLLDDTLSAVDNRTAHAILSELHRSAAHGHCTIIMVSQRLSNVMKAHTIAVLQEGRITEIGDHASLVAKPLDQSWYARQWRMQQLHERLGHAP